MQTRQGEVGHIRVAGPISLPRTEMQRSQRKREKTKHALKERKKGDSSLDFSHVLVSEI
jgi:hypothetical protein